METREENLKKINEELEKLDDEQLEQVAGGTVRESWEIFQILKQKKSVRMGLYDLPDYLKNNYGIDAKIDGYPDFDEGRANVYSRNGESLTHQQVLDIIKSE
ncbi:MAG: hypothetical protein IKK40_07385 [Bacteroidales bacterium]|nr:hypothetical protein [Bacteroidales bacterium]